MTLYELFDAAQTWMGIHGREDLAWSAKCLSIKHEDVTPKVLYSEMSFAILASGFRVATIQKRWPEFTKIFLDWEPLKVWESMVLVGGEREAKAMRDRALKLLNNERKIFSIFRNARILSTLVTDEDDEKWPEFRDSIYENVDVLKNFVYIGDTLKYHVARNIGVDTIKPDVHMMRIAKHYGYDVFEMAKMLSKQFAMPKHTVDTILWRYSERGLTDEFWRSHHNR